MKPNKKTVIASDLSLRVPLSGTKQSSSRELDCFGHAECGLAVTHTQGSALIIALIVTGVLMTLVMGVSSLIISMLRSSTTLLEKTKAWYAAESAMEHALLDISANQSGFEEKKEEVMTEDPAVRYEYNIAAVTNQIPQKAVYEIQQEEDTYAVLHFNESVTIPLFSGMEMEDAVKTFRIDYYLSPDLSLRGGYIDDDLDILRWKIFGIAGDGTTEVLNEYAPANKGNSAASPTCVGTDSDCYNSAKFYKRSFTSDGSIEFNLIQTHPISTFLNEHSQNFLVLTNALNVDLVSGSLSNLEKQEIANIRYRIMEKDGGKNLTLPTVKIMADGFSGQSKQSLDIEIKRDNILPVFNYALYRTAD